MLDPWRLITVPAGPRIFGPLFCPVDAVRVIPVCGLLTADVLVLLVVVTVVLGNDLELVGTGSLFWRLTLVGFCRLLVDLVV